MEEAEWQFYLINSTISLLLVLFGGCMSGLTIGLLSISDIQLDIQQQAGSQIQKQQARKLKPIIKDHHQLLVTLLLANALAMQALPLFLDEMVPGYVAVLISTTLVLIFGEVVPQAILTGPDQLKLACKLVPLVWVVKILFYPLAWPIAKILDKCLGHKIPTRYQNKDLKALVNLHVNQRPSSSLSNSDLIELQAKIIHGAIDANKKTVQTEMMPLHRVKYISQQQVLTKKFLEDLQQIGYSRLPVYRDSPAHIIGVLQVKKLISINPEKEITLKQSGIKIRKPLIVDRNDKLLDMFKLFSKGKGHLALVHDQNGKTIGIITLQDIIESLVNREIYDQDDIDSMTRSALNKMNLIQKFQSFMVEPEMTEPLLIAGRSYSFRKDQQQKDYWIFIFAYINER